jgi:hypothetical protein
MIFEAYFAQTLDIPPIRISSLNRGDMRPDLPEQGSLSRFQAARRKKKVFNLFGDLFPGIFLKRLTRNVRIRGGLTRPDIWHPRSGFTHLLRLAASTLVATAAAALHSLQFNIDCHGLG